MQLFKTILQAVKGHRTIGLALAGIAYGVSGYLLGALTFNDAAYVVWNGLMVIYARLGIKEIEHKMPKE